MATFIAEHVLIVTMKIRTNKMGAAKKGSVEQT
jgi:hypothetical protein